MAAAGGEAVVQAGVYATFDLSNETGKRLTLAEIRTDGAEGRQVFEDDQGRLWNPHTPYVLEPAGKVRFGIAHYDVPSVSAVFTFVDDAGNVVSFRAKSGPWGEGICERVEEWQVYRVQCSYPWGGQNTTVKITNL
ncbi:hypothetical protein [Streptomyces sp. NPDC008121]|uniref:hypothetical protein n=1 Tax=Streptomyces sp. NPDC008121 TaxID=3364809 RepID=UPI0036E75DC9